MKQPFTCCLSKGLRTMVIITMGSFLSGCLTTGSAYDPWFSSPRYQPAPNGQTVPPPAAMQLAEPAEQQIPAIEPVQDNPSAWPEPYQSAPPTARRAPAAPAYSTSQGAQVPASSYTPPASHGSAVSAQASASATPISITPVEEQEPSTAETELGLPPDAKPGECYAKVYVPPQYEMREERVLLQEESERVEIVPAEFEWVEEPVAIKEAGEEIEVVPAEYKWVEEKIQVAPATTRIEEIPAEYDWVEEKVMIKPAEYVWKKGRGPIEELDNATGEIMCLVEIPPEYEIVQKKILKSPATTRTIDIPAEHKTIRKQVMTKPPQALRVPTEPEYTTILVKKLLMPERQVTVPIPPQYGTIRKEVMVREGKMQWRRVLCQTNVTPDVIKRIQEALSQRGYDVGSPNGVLGQETVEAVKSYQRVNGLAVGGLTYETLDSLGVEVATSI